MPRVQNHCKHILISKQLFTRRISCLFWLKYSSVIAGRVGTCSIDIFMQDLVAKIYYCSTSWALTHNKRYERGFHELASNYLNRWIFSMFNNTFCRFIDRKNIIIGITYFLIKK